MQKDAYKIGLYFLSGTTKPFDTVNLPHGVFIQQERLLNLACYPGPLRDAGTTGAAGAAGAVAPVAFCRDNFTGALRVHNEGAAERV